MALCDRDRAILDFERSWWTEPGPKRAAIERRFQMSSGRYYQLLSQPLESSEAVANGTKTSGAGSKVADTLRKAGYNILAPTNTTTTAASSAVLFLPGFAAEAGAVATALGLAPATVMPVPTPSPVANAQAANVVV